MLREKKTLVQGRVRRVLYAQCIRNCIKNCTCKQAFTFFSPCTVRLIFANATPMLFRAAHSYIPSSALPTSRMVRVPDELTEKRFASVMRTLSFIHTLTGWGAPRDTHGMCAVRPANMITSLGLSTIVGGTRFQIKDKKYRFCAIRPVQEKSPPFVQRPYAYGKGNGNIGKAT